ncbi:MAG: S8 family peptidase [Opitutales bacterium]
MRFSRMFWLCIALTILGVLLGLLWTDRAPLPGSGEPGAGIVLEGEAERTESSGILDDFTHAAASSKPPGEIPYPQGAVEGELVVHFDSREDYLNYLKALAGAGHTPLGRIDELLAVRISEEVWLGSNVGESGARADYSYSVVQPAPPERVAPAELGRLLAYGASARSIVGGISDGNGSGIRVGVLDSGIAGHTQFDDVEIVKIDLAGGGVAGSGSDHGTAVASIISGSEGIVPEAELIAVRVLDEAGRGNSFHLADGIVRSVDLGVDIINMSLGLYEDAPIVRQAIRYAADRGVLLVAPAGNDGFDQMAYPAAYAEVLSVTAVDASGRQAGFPNQSEAIDFAAPGVGVEAALGDEGTKLFSGTSAATPFVSGTLASLISGEETMDPEAAVALLQRTLNDAGAPGRDPVYGAGALDWQRLRERHITDLVDLALADIHLDPEALPGTTMPVEVTVQNRGTKWLNQAQLEVLVEGSDPVSFSIGTLGPGQIATRKVYTQVPSGSEARLDLAARVLPDGVDEDVRLDNNIKAVSFRPR